MKFVDDRIPNMTPFKEIKRGEVFLIEDGEEPYMKIHEIKNEKDEYCNAVNLANGLLDFFTNDEGIIKCNAFLKIY
jgi:hypothetical protein